MYTRPVHLWSTGAQHVVIVYMPSYALPRRATVFLTARLSSAAFGLQPDQGENYLHSFKLATRAILARATAMMRPLALSHDSKTGEGLTLCNSPASNRSQASRTSRCVLYSPN